MNLNTLKVFVSRILLHPIIRASIYYSFLLIAFFLLFIGIAVIFGVHDSSQIIGWIIGIIGLIPVVFMIKFQGWFFPKTENSELKQPTKVLSRVLHTSRSFLLLIFFYLLYLLCFVVFYFAHFSFIHHVLWYGMEGEVVLHEWCPLGEHSYHLSEELFCYIMSVPFALSLLCTIVFNHSNKMVRLILFLLPVAGMVVFLYLHFSCIDAILARFS